MPLPERFHGLPAAAGVESVQVTLVDCPGHASLIRTIIGGAHIIDLVLLVVDVTRGIQAQTVECVVIAEVTTRRVVIVLNKVRNRGPVASHSLPLTLSLPILTRLI